LTALDGSPAVVDDPHVESGIGEDAGLTAISISAKDVSGFHQTACSRFGVANEWVN